MAQRSNSLSQLIDAVLSFVGAVFFVWLLYAAIYGVGRKDLKGAGATFLFAIMNGLISLSAFRRLRAAVRLDREIDAKDRRAKDWKGDPIE